MSDDELARLKALKELWTSSFSGPAVALELLEFTAREGNVFVVARTITRDADGSIRDVREQECFMGALADYDDDARNAAMAEAFAAVAQEVVDTCSAERWETVMPADVMPRDLAGLGNCETRAQFEKALRTKKRLGPLLPDAHRQNVLTGSSD